MSVAAGADPLAPTREVVARRAVAVGGVHVDELRLARDLRERLPGGEPHVRDPLLDAGGAQVLREGMVVLLALLGGAADLARPAVVAGVRSTASTTTSSEAPLASTIAERPR